MSETAISNETSTEAPKVGFVSLGCPKALTDSELILTQLSAEGYQTAKTFEGADLVIVNTCGFIDDAVKESLDTIAEALAESNSGARRTLDRVNEIATAANQQGVASAEIARNVERVAQMTEENSAGVATVSGSARELETLSHELLREVSLFKA